jgi:hypothetical protein
VKKNGNADMTAKAMTAAATTVSAALCQDISQPTVLSVGRYIIRPRLRARDLHHKSDVKRTAGAPLSLAAGRRAGRG